MTTPLILNQASTSSFAVDIPDNDYTKGLKLMVQGVTLPNINMMMTDVPLNPMLRGKIPGSAIEFDPLMIRIAVDEELSAYFGCYQWVLGTIDYVNADSRRWHESDQTVSVHFLDNSMSKTVATFHFYGAFPYNVGELEMMYTNDTNEVVTCMVSFGFKYMEIERDGKIIRPSNRKNIR